MFSDAASLHPVSCRPKCTCQDNIPAVVVIAVDVEHLLALDTKDTASMSVFAQEPSSSPCVTLKVHIQ